MKDLQQYGLPVYQALHASTLLLNYSQELTPFTTAFVRQCQQQWGDFEPNSLTRALLTATELEASFAATLLFFRESTDCLIHAEHFFSHPNPWVRWPMTLLLVEFQPMGWYAALCQMLPDGLTQDELEDKGNAIHTFMWRQKCLSLLTRFRNVAVIPFVCQALETTIPWSQYIAGTFPYSILCDFQCRLIQLVADLDASSPLQSDTIPSICGDLWRCSWVTWQLRKQYAENDIIHSHFLQHPEIHAHIRQELQRTFGYTDSEQERAIQTYLEYEWFWFIYRK